MSRSAPGSCCATRVVGATQRITQSRNAASLELAERAFSHMGVTAPFVTQSTLSGIEALLIKMDSRSMLVGARLR